MTVSAGQTQAQWTSSDIGMETALEAASRYVTLKTGDVIIPMLSPVRLPIAPDDIIECSIGDHEVLRVKIK